MKIKNVTLRCDDGAEAVVFSRYIYGDGYEDSFEINVEDSFCGYTTKGLIARFKRAWAAFIAKPVIYTGVFSDDKNKMRKFLTDCLAVLDEPEVSQNDE